LAAFGWRAAITLGLVLALLVLTTVNPASAQERGTVTGTVVAAGSLAPLASTQVYLEGTGIGGLSNPSGRFLLLNVPTGTYTVVVERIGYATGRQEITVRAGESTSVSFELDEVALGLDEIVVTGTAGAARRREVGNSIAQLNTSEISEPIMSTDALLQGRAAGIQVTEQSGSPGGGAKIRLRGNVSAAMSNQPLIYVDGVRARSEGLPKNVGALGYGGRGANMVYGPLNDINPDDIERIEVIKGAAATTLYGTEAAAGVIQIFTKRGQTGEARWTGQIDQGFAKLHAFGPTEGFRGEALRVPPNEDQAPPIGEPDDPAFMFIDPYLRTAYRQKYSLSVSGGIEDLSYFLSGTWNDAEGVLPLDEEEKLSVRGNFSATPLDGLTLDWNTSYARTAVDQTTGGPSAQGIILNTFRRNRNYLGTTDVETVSRLFEYKNWENVDHFISGLTATYAPSGAFSNRFTVGYDRVEQSAGSLRPFGFIQAPLGIAHANEFVNTTLTLDYVGTWTRDFAQDLRSSLSFGGQSISTEEHSVEAYGEDFPSPGDATVSNAAQTFGFEDKIRVVNAGFFVQELLGFKDRYFLTVGLRVDGNSSFGEDLGLEAYPKASLSYVLSDEDFWNDSWGEIKLRTAWGQSGRAPGAFDAVRTWNPIGWGGQPAFRPQNLGNPELGPERTTELEVGFDAAFLDNRLSVDFTYYHQKTTDALFEVNQIPSQGFLGNQLENIGELKNTGIELSVFAHILDRANWGLELGTTLTTNNAEVLDLGGATEFSIGGNGFIVEGEAVPVIRGRCVTNPDAFADPIIEEDCIYGPNLPTEIITGSASLRMPYGLRLDTRGEYQAGHYAYNVNDGEAFSRGIRWPNCFNVLPDIDAGNLSNVNALERARCISTFADRNFAIYPQDFFKLREVSLSAPIPYEFPGGGSATVVLSARNTLRWKKAKYNFADPESSGGFQRGETGMNQATQTIGGSIPTPAFYTLSVRFSF
jgi:TonB-linked SusC/RagA family outer membrane protein